MSNRVRLKIGDCEVEAEGEKSFLLDELPKLMESLSKQLNGLGVATNLAGNTGNGRQESVRRADRVSTQMTTGTMAARLGFGSGSDLVLAASAKLALSDGMEIFNRSQLLESMRSATAYFRESFAGNLSKYLTQLVKDGKLNEVGSGKYALTASALSEIEPKLS